MFQGQKQLSEGLTDAVQSLDLGETESDTDSISTPSSSPSHHNHPGNTHVFATNFHTIN